MNVSEAARFLHVSERTLRRWMRQGLLRGTGPGGDEFARDVLERWARGRGMRTGHAPRVAPSAGERPVAAALERGTVAEVSAKDTYEALRIAVMGVPGLDAVRSADLLARVADRERMASTAVGGGVALPHPRTPPGDLFDQPVVAVAYLEPELDWAALDGRPVHTALLLLSPSPPAHLQLLSRVAALLRSPGIEELLRSRPDHPELVRAVRELEEGLST